VAEAAIHRRRPRRSSVAVPGSRLLLVPAIALTFVIAGYVFYVTVLSPWLRVSRVVVQADFEIERSTLLESIGLDGPTSFFSVRPAEIVAQLEAHPMIKSASVERIFPDTVRLDLTRRRPLALALTTRNGRSTPIVLDESGTIFDAGAHLAERDIPVLSGIAFEGNVVGNRLPAGLVPLLEDLQHLRVSSPEIYGLISEIRVEPRVAGGFDLLLFTKGFPVPVRTDGTLDRDTCTYALMVLDVLAQRGEADGVAEIDFRSGEIVYRMKEADSGR
jgi:cell division protein FtsQ